ncbi:hypothetical protein L1987_69647 [Smallanthus sonchifolius]|uniref:Uncharacterized protein n=1 Tax=Smallanthus sonchifolius TaxID=185202 RepID=A0ACB9B798_9ASTR|nr:hypothetical protein L1987_69647 [Smallanthus sonchifolius]
MIPLRPLIVTVVSESKVLKEAIWEKLVVDAHMEKDWKKRRVCVVREFPLACGPANHINSYQARNIEPEEEEPEEEESDGEKLDDTNNEDLEDLVIVNNQDGGA